MSSSSAREKSFSSAQAALALFGSRRGLISKVFESRDKTDRTMLHHAAEKGDVELVRALASSGLCELDADGPRDDVYDHSPCNFLCDDNTANVYEACYCGRTPLCLAIDNGHIECVRALIEAGANVNEGTGDVRMPPLCRAGSKEIFELLLSKGADPNGCDNAGDTVLLRCARDGDYEFMEILIESIEEKDLADCVQEALNAAVERGVERCVEILLRAGARIDEKYEYSAFAEAVKRNYEPIVSLLTLQSPKVVKAFAIEKTLPFALSKARFVLAFLAYVRAVKKLELAVGKSQSSSPVARALLQRTENACPVYENIAFFSMKKKYANRWCGESRCRLSVVLFHFTDQLKQCNNRFDYRKLLCDIAEGVHVLETNEKKKRKRHD